jgi:hypothetical protein
MDTEEISYVIRCLGVVAVCLAVAGAIFTYNILLELSFFSNLLIRIGLQ